VGHGFSDIFDCPLKIKVLIENFLSLQGHGTEGRNINQQDSRFIQATEPIEQQKKIRDQKPYNQNNEIGINPC